MPSNPSIGNLNMILPRILIIDDLFGRNVHRDRNMDRENLCAHFLLLDSSNDDAARACRQKILQPTAEAVFCRAQSPVCANIRDTVENDIQMALDAVQSGWPIKSDVKNQKSEVRPWAMLLLDLCFYTGLVTEESHRRTPGMPNGRPGDDDPANYFGLTLLDEIHKDFPELPIFILSSKPRDEVSLEFSRRGALGFIARDDYQGPELLKEALWQHGLLPDPTGEIVGNSLQFLLALREARRSARHRENLLIRGERGTGKELLANYVHRMSSLSKDGRDRPFVTVNSAVLTPGLFASELFGIQPRTATGVDGKIGLIESAHLGDLFLDEIADMPAEIQGAMLRVLQERQITSVGARKAKDVDVRFLSATNADLESEKGSFRSDLLDRLRIGGTLWLPPLRERSTDISLLAEKFIREAESQRKGAMQRQITAETLEVLCSYDWPGNIRELRSIIFDAVNRYPDVEHFVPGHLRFSAGKVRNIVVPNHSILKTSTAENLPPPEGSVEIEEENFLQLVESMARFQFDQADRAAWAGKFGQFQSVVAQLAARYIKAALLANRRPTPENPAGAILIHPAMKLLTGDRNLTATKAADLIKRQLNISPGDREKILNDDILREAYEIAMRLRPSTVKKKSGASKEPSSYPGDE